MDSRILDTHFHWWDTSVLRYPWLVNEALSDGVFFVARGSLPTRYSPLDYGADTAPTSVLPFVHIEAACLAADSVAETRWVERLVSQHSVDIRLVAGVDLSSPQLEGVLEQHRIASGGLAGVRHIVTWHPTPRFSFVERDLLTDESWRRGLALVARQGLTFDLQIYAAQASNAVAVARLNPDLRLVVEHAGLPLEWDLIGLRAWRTAMVALAAAPNIAMKIGGLAMVKRDWKQSEVVPRIRELVEIFGPSRCMLSTNFPLERASHTIHQLIAAWEQALEPFSPTERAAVRATAAEEWYGGPRS